MNESFPFFQVKICDRGFDRFSGSVKCLFKWFPEKNIIFYLGWIQKVRLPVLWMNHNIWLLLFCPLILFHFQSTIDTLPWCWQNLSGFGSCLLLSLISCHHWDLPGKATDTSTTANSVRQSQWEQREKKVCQKLVCGIKVLILCVNQGEEVLRLLIMPNGSNQP